LGDGSARQLLRDKAKAGDPRAQKYVYLRLVKSAVEGGDPLPSKLREAVKWLEAHAAPDEWPVQLVLAEVMRTRKLAVFDLNAANEKLARAVGAGVDEARTMQGEMAWQGIGQKKEPSEAVRIWKEMAEKGDGRALSWLAWLCWWGNGAELGVAKDASRAFDFARRAAVTGYWLGQMDLADCYFFGIGTETNYYQAAKYYDMLAKRGYLEARDKRSRILALIKD
jgi:TPR repeat protein